MCAWTGVPCWEFCDETDEHSGFTAIRINICSWATVISTRNTLQPPATAVYSIMFQFNYAPIQLYSNSIMLQFNYAPIQICSNSIIFQLNYAPIQLRSNSIMLQFNYTPIQLCSNSIMLQFNYAPIQLCSNSPTVFSVTDQ